MLSCCQRCSLDRDRMPMTRVSFYDHDATQSECAHRLPRNYKHNFLTQEFPFFVLSIVGLGTNLPRSHFLILAGGVVLKFHFNSNWDDLRVPLLWLNWTFKIMGNYYCKCGKTATEGNYCKGSVHFAFILVQAVF